MVPPSVASAGFRPRSANQSTLSTSSVVTSVPTCPVPTDFDRDISTFASAIESRSRLSPFYICATDSKVPPIVTERYSDKYRVVQGEAKLSSLGLDSALYPEELYSVVIPGYSVKKKSTQSKFTFGDALARLQNFEGRDEGEDGVERPEEDEEEGILVEDEEIDEEDNDYCVSYFDNGEDTGDYETGGGDDGPVY